MARITLGCAVRAQDQPLLCHAVTRKLEVAKRKASVLRCLSQQHGATQDLIYQYKKTPTKFKRCSQSLPSQRGKEEGKAESK